MIETSCDLYITIQSKDLATVVEQYSIREKGDGNISYYPDHNAFCFYVEFFDRADLYDAVPASELFLTENIIKWIDEIIAIIPDEAKNSFSTCVQNAEYVEMVVNFRSVDYDEDDKESFRGVLQNGKYRRSKRINNDYKPSDDWGKADHLSAFAMGLGGGLQPLYAEPTLAASANCINIARQISSAVTSIDFRGKTFVHTACGSESAIDERVIAKGGFVRPSTVLETDYIIIGNNIQIVSAKARRAIELNQKGKNIKAITEEEFWNLC